MVLEQPGKSSTSADKEAPPNLKLLWLDFGKEKPPVLGCGAVPWKRELNKLKLPRLVQILNTPV